MTGRPEPIMLFTARGKRMPIPQLVESPVPQDDRIRRMVAASEAVREALDSRFEFWLDGKTLCIVLPRRGNRRQHMRIVAKLIAYRSEASMEVFLRTVDAWDSPVIETALDMPP